MFDRLNFGYSIDIGCEREKQEDYTAYREFDDGSLFFVVADGTGSRENYLQPGVIVATDIMSAMEKMYAERPKLFLSDPEYFLRGFMRNANNLLGAFKVANEEIFNGYAASVTCTYISRDGFYNTVYAGNVRQYLLRQGKIIQLTRDHTAGTELVENGTMDIETYYVDASRLQLTSGLGIVADPRVDAYEKQIRETDVLLTATDGIAYALRPEYICQIVLEAGEPLRSCRSLIEAARDVVKYPDNMCAAIVTGISEK